MQFNKKVTFHHIRYFSSVFFIEILFEWTLNDFIDIFWKVKNDGFFFGCDSRMLCLIECLWKYNLISLFCVYFFIFCVLNWSNKYDGHEFDFIRLVVNNLSRLILLRFDFLQYIIHDQRRYVFEDWYLFKIEHDEVFLIRCFVLFFAYFWDS